MRHAYDWKYSVDFGNSNKNTYDDSTTPPSVLRYALYPYPIYETLREIQGLNNVAPYVTNSIRDN